MTKQDDTGNILLAKNVTEMSDNQVQGPEDDYQEFVEKADVLEALFQRAKIAISEGDFDTILHHWPAMKRDLEILMAMALRLKTGNHAVAARQRLDELLTITKKVQQGLLDATPPADNAHQQALAHQAYKPNQAVPIRADQSKLKTTGIKDK